MNNKSHYASLCFTWMVALDGVRWEENELIFKKEKAFIVKQLTLVHGAILEDQFVDELEALLLR